MDGARRSRCPGLENRWIEPDVLDEDGARSGERLPVLGAPQMPGAERSEDLIRNPQSGNLAPARVLHPGIQAQIFQVTTFAEQNGEVFLRRSGVLSFTYQASHTVINSQSTDHLAQNETTCTTVPDFVGGGHRYNDMQTLHCRQGSAHTKSLRVREIAPVQFGIALPEG